MKISSAKSISQFLAGVLNVAITTFCTGSAHAQILLTINDSTPTAVVISATGTFPSTDATVTIYNGIDLLGFFNPPESFTNFAVASSTLAASDGSGSTLTFAKADVDNYGSSDANLGLYTATSGSVSFTTTAAAFSGSLTLDLSAFPLPTNGATGTVQTGYAGGGPNTPIGEWEIVNPVAAPEPATWALLACSLVLVPVMRRFQRA